MGCSVGRSVCSICGAESGACEPREGPDATTGSSATMELREPADAYEWSFVAVPAQRAGRRGEDASPGRSAPGGARKLRRLQGEAAAWAAVPDGAAPGGGAPGHAGGRHPGRGRFWRRRRKSWRRRSFWSCGRAMPPGADALFPVTPQLRPEGTAGRRRPWPRTEFRV